MTGTAPNRQWWKESVVYQIYPRSFNDTDGDGVGDIPGIVEKLDYLDALGIDVVWLNPVYESPGVDNGYDIADYRAVKETFGTMEDLEALLEGLHDRDMRLIMDLVVNHTSSQHEWFVDARQSTDADCRDYYIWREGRSHDRREDSADDPDAAPVGHQAVGSDGGTVQADQMRGERPPNNWESFFGGPAWEYDERSGEWYLHVFGKQQPDLNWENPEVRDEIFEMMEWWLEKGIDGFRMDVINILSKPAELPDGEDPHAIVRGADRFVNGPKIHDYLGEMYDRVLADRDVMTVGEMVDLDVEQARQYVGDDGDGMNMAFNFDHMRLDFGDGGGRWTRGEWTVSELKETLTHWQNGLADDGWNSIYFNNHDEPRMVSRFGDDGAYHDESAKCLATLLLTLQGTPFLYQGEEIGMTNYPFESLDEVRDVDTLRNVAAARREGRLTTQEEVMSLVRYRSRDNARTPMQWSPTDDFAGFSDGEPWIEVNPNHSEINVTDQRADSDSIWHYYRDAIALRKEREVLVYGRYDLVVPDHEQIWAYTRTLGDDRALVVLNLSPQRPTFEPPPELAGVAADVLISNYDADPETVESVDLQPYEARVYDLD